MKTLLLLTGPTAVGKTELSLQLAERLSSPILSADSRQLYRDIPIGTAAPTAEQQARVKHYFVGTLALTDYYSAAQYEQDVLALLPELFRERDVVVMTGGSMLYLDAVSRGIDDIPTILPEVREELRRRLEVEGLPRLTEELRLLDSAYYERADLRNTQRIVHALEVVYQTGRPYSSFLRGEGKQRSFRTLKVVLNREREALFERINRRVTLMMEQGLMQEVERVAPFRTANALNTVGYKELFRVLDGEWELPFALERIRKNTRVYAKKQLTWFRRDEAAHWLAADDAGALDHILRMTDRE